jgi:hypothetical protein
MKKYKYPMKLILGYSDWFVKYSITATVELSKYKARENNPIMLSFKLILLKKNISIKKSNKRTQIAPLSCISIDF